MNHILLFAYFLNISFGAGGVVAMAILHHRLRRRETGALLFIMSCLLASLFVALLSYYITRILGEPDHAGQWRFILGFAVTFITYLGIIRLLLSLSSFSKTTVYAATAAVVAVQAARFFLILWGPEELAARFRMPALVLISCYLLFMGIALYRAAGMNGDGTVSFLLRSLSILTIIFAPLSTVFYFLIDLLPGGSRLGISLDFLFILAWSVFSIIGFLRYLSRPTALLEEGKVSQGFISAYGITARETEVVELISRGLSNKEIAENMHVSFTTARTHIYNIFRKTGARSRVELLQFVTGYRE